MQTTTPATSGAATSSNLVVTAEERALVREHTAKTDVHGVRLRLITADCPLYHETDESALPFEAPWWAFCWPGGLALTRFVLENPELFKGKRVLDVGSGCGSVSLACALVGAREIVANDVDRLAGVALAENAELNGLKMDGESAEGEPKLSFLQENRIGAGKAYFDAFDVVVVGDMLYDADFSPTLLQDLAHHRGVYFGDPGRTYCPQEVSEDNLLASYDHHEDGFSAIRVFRLTAA
ncbi:Electron transfer flavoprotein beta subunit lysine methyltransferase [Hondaea fermentalgiana]|uniref:ETFB lysine methyltransferase n=1 Tax=Hondaea fermentalgiana TaxID=2315210 RepID=A0A2R5GN80_9STRA|nr:Electron transfer flavoprotein beta subunit lysine methyltransferase [Hondaea fermentalgiana]|eukprot:GBG32357.1 Electron transfer flavoprotein beta subunit lysine methyltransferase [Hondaea fermentalgiana]